jgi:DNA-binding SARP family transcriptional activator
MGQSAEMDRRVFMIRLRMLGVLDLRGSDGRALRSILAQPKRLALLSYLSVTNARAFLRRDQVLALFWPEQDNDHARAALNRALYYLRKSLGNDTLLSRGDDEIGLSGENFWCDTGALVTAAAEGRHRDVVELYRGDLLEGFHISDAPGFERWVETERNRFRAMAVHAAWTLSEAEESAGNHGLAAHWARWAAERSPYDEAAVQRLMTFLDRSGDRAGAMHAYEQFIRHIADDLELSPSPETRAHAEAIRTREEPNDAERQVGHPKLSHEQASPLEFLRADHSVEGTPAIEPLVETSAVPAVPQLALAARFRRWQRPAAAIAGAAVILALAVAILIPVVRWQSALDQQLIVVMPLQNLTGDPSLDGLARITTEWTTQGLADFLGESTSSLPPGRRRVERVREGGDIRRVTKQMRAGTAVSGAMYRDGDRLLFHARVALVNGGIAWPIRPVSVPVDSAERAIREVRDRVTGAAAALLNPCVAPWLRLGTEPPTFEAYAEFGRGNYPRAAQLDTAFTWAVLFAATADMQAADGGPFRRRINDSRRVRADSIAEALNAMRGRLAPLQRHWLDWKLAYRTENWLTGYHAMHSADMLAANAFNVSFARSAMLLHRPRESLNLLERRFPDFSCQNVRAQRLLMAQLHHQLGEHERELEVVRLAREHEDGLDVLWHELRARIALHQVDRALALLDTSLSYPRTKDYPPGALMATAAEEFWGHGHPQAYTEARSQAIDWYRSRPGDEASGDRFSMALALYYARRWNEADSLFRRLAADRQDLWSEIQGYLGASAARRGDRAEAVRILLALERLTQSTERPVAEVFYAQARIRALLGDREGAVRSLHDWIGGQGFDLHTEIDFESLADYEPFREFIRPKG